jgi:predicted CoA-binding protein
VVLIREGVNEIDGVVCVPNLKSLPARLDLLVVAIGAHQVPGLVDEIISLDAANSVMLIPGGLGENEASKERAAQVIARINAVHGTKNYIESRLYMDTIRAGAAI